MILAAVACVLVCVSCVGTEQRVQAASPPGLDASLGEAKGSSQAVSKSGARAHDVSSNMSHDDHFVGGGDRWLMSDLGARVPSFPYLLGERRDISRSINDTSDGYLVHAHRLGFPQPHLAILDVQSHRYLNYTSDELAFILQEASRHVAKSYPDAVTYIGNLSAKGGGDIPYSISHNSGRDADIAFFVLNEHGEPAVMPSLLPLDEEGRYVGDEGTFIFDVPRTWALVEGLIKASGDSLQHLFVANWLRDRMLEYALLQHADAAVIARAKAVMKQPRASLPHNDHLHLRIFCSAVDRASGCVNTGRSRSWRNNHNDSYKAVIKKAHAALEHKSPRMRLMAVRRLALLGHRPSSSLLMKALADKDPVVRAAAGRALSFMNRGAKQIGKALFKEHEPQVVAEWIVALGKLGGRAGADTLKKMLRQKRMMKMSVGLELDARLMAVDALATMEEMRVVPALLTLLLDEDAATRVRAARALRMTTNHRMYDGDWALLEKEGREHVVTVWRDWWKKARKRPRAFLVAQGFVQAGYEVKRLTGKFVWPICKAISEDDYLSYNAQRALMRLSGKERATLSWSKKDASFWWRRWFERRARRYGAPPIPLAMSTLQPAGK